MDTDGDALSDGFEVVTSLTSPLKPTTDGDGCTDSQELGLSRVNGGDRDPLSPWDFYDVPVPALTAGDPSGTRNLVINLSDVAAIILYIGTTNGGGANINGVSYNTDLNGNGVFDGIEYDRMPSANIAKKWRSQAPNGAVSLQDAAVAISSVGDHCAVAPSPPRDDVDGDGLSDADEITLGTCPGLVPAYVRASAVPHRWQPRQSTHSRRDGHRDGLGDGLETYSYGPGRWRATRK